MIVDNRGKKTFAIPMNLDPDFVNKIEYLLKIYGESFEILNGLDENRLNFTSFINNFIDSKSTADVSIDANANRSSHDICSLMADMCKPHSKLLAIHKIYYEMKKAYGVHEANTWLELEWNGAFYLHDACSATYKPYCYSYDLDQLVEKGLYFISSFKVGPAQHLTTFNDHVHEFICWTCNRSSGAVGMVSYLVYNWYFWHKDVESGYYLKDPEYYRRQCFQQFIHNLNQSYLREGVECAFTNITIMDRCYLTELFGSRKFPDGTYAIDFIEEICEHQKIFMEVLSETRRKTMMTFPVITYSLLYQDGKFVDEEFAKWCNKHNMDWYDANFYVGNSVTSLSNCCRLVSDTTKIDAFINSIGGTALSIGSVKVNTINLRRIALECDKNEERYFEILRSRVNQCMKVLDCVRRIIKRNNEKGLLPNYKYGLIDLEKQFNTIGITAMYETMVEFDYITSDEFGNKSYSDDAVRFSSKIMEVINSIKDNAGYDYSINVENVPGERCNTIFCEKDTLMYPMAAEYMIYSNQWIPLMEKCTINEKIRLGAILDKKCGGGQISHINLGTRFTNEEQSWDMLNYIAQQGVIYFAYNTKISVCEHDHAFFGDVCPECGEPVKDYFTRVVGYLTPVSSWSKERRGEFVHRKWFELSEIINGHDDMH